MNRKKLEKLYNEAKEQRKVWKGEGKDKRWKFKKADGSIVTKATEEKLKEAFMEYHKTKSLADEKCTTTYAELYSAWLDYKQEQVGTKKGNYTLVPLGDTKGIMSGISKELPSII